MTRVRPTPGRSAIAPARPLRAHSLARGWLLGLALLAGVATSSHAQTPPAPAGQPPATPPSGSEARAGAPAPAAPEAPKPAGTPAEATAKPPAQAPSRTAPKGRFTPSEEVSPDNDVPFPVDI